MSVMSSERRKSRRVKTRLEASWEGVLTRREGTVVDISASGCFVLTSDDVQTGELVRLTVQTPTGRTIFVWGEVVYQISEMGFALHFTGMSEKETRMLEMLIDYLHDN